MAQSFANHVFISYSRKDQQVTQRIVTFLRGQGIIVWVDSEKLIPGTAIWEEEIERAINNCSAVVVVLSPDAKVSEWVRRETTLTEQYRKHIFPVLVRGDENSSIPLRLITRQYVDLRKNEKAGLQALSIALLSHMQGLEDKGQANLPVPTTGKPDVSASPPKPRITPTDKKRRPATLLIVPGIAGFFILIVGLCLVAAFLYQKVNASLDQASPSPPAVTATSTRFAQATPTPRSTSTPRPSSTPNIAETQYFASLRTELQTYVNKGYLSSSNGSFITHDDFGKTLSTYVASEEILASSATNLYISAHFDWSVPVGETNAAGCGFFFARPEGTDDGYGVFLQNSRIYFNYIDGDHYTEVGKTRGSGRVSFTNPASADFTLIVNDYYAYVIVNSTVTEYTLARSNPITGGMGIWIWGSEHGSVRCEMSDIHAWISN